MERAKGFQQFRGQQQEQQEEEEGKEEQEGGCLVRHAVAQFWGWGNAAGCEASCFCDKGVVDMQLIG